MLFQLRYVYQPGHKRLPITTFSVIGQLVNKLPAPTSLMHDQIFQLFESMKMDLETGNLRDVCIPAPLDA
jgi:hypothetical protein